MLNPDDNTKASQPPKLLEQVRSRLRVKHYSIRTERTYVDWIKRFIWFHGKRHPKDMGAVEMEAFYRIWRLSEMCPHPRRIKPRVRCFFV